jgi:hypothetical protein
MTSTDFATQSGYVLDRLAAAIRDSGQDDPADPGVAACAPEGWNAWCSTDVAGAWLNSAWNTFATWAPPALGFVGAPTTVTAGAAEALTVQLQVAGVERTTDSPVSVSLATTSAQGSFAPAADGPWTPTLDLTIPAGASSATLYYRDTRAGTATISAASSGRVSAARTLTVTSGPLAQLAVSPPSATVAAGATQAFSASGADAYGNDVPVSPTWTLAPGTPGTLSASASASTTFSASPAAGGSGSVFATVGSVTASAPLVVTPPKLSVSSIGYGVSRKHLVVTFTVVRTSDGARMPGVSIAFSTYRDGVEFASATVQTGADGRAVYTSSAQVRSGCYTSRLAGVSGAALTWDGTTPASQYCR